MVAIKSRALFDTMVRHDGEPATCVAGAQSCLEDPGYRVTGRQASHAQESRAGPAGVEAAGDERGERAWKTAVRAGMMAARSDPGGSSPSVMKSSASAAYSRFTRCSVAWAQEEDRAGGGASTSKAQQQWMHTTGDERLRDRRWGPADGGLR